MNAVYFARLGVLVFFAICFLQSGLDKFIDRKGNLEYFRSHFARSPIAGLVPFLLPALALLETVTGLICLVAAWSAGSGDLSFAHWALSLCFLTLLSLFAGQRIAKDYAGAATIGSYFAVALGGAILLGLPT